MRTTAPTEQSLRGADLVRLAGMAGFAAVLLSPIRHYIGPMERVSVQKIEKDSFPLSTYPMFSEDRRGRVIIPHVIGLSDSGERIQPHYSHYGAGGLNQVRKQIARDVRSGRAVQVAQRFADSLAEPREVSGSTEIGTVRRIEREARIVHIEVVRSRFHFDEYFSGQRLPRSETIHARCVVGGTAETQSSRGSRRGRKDAR